MNNSKLIPQGSLEWLIVRYGRFTASKIAAIICKIGKDGKAILSKGAKTYILQCAMEGILQESLSNFTSSAMQDGTENEINAAKAYQKKNKVFAVTTGFWCFGDHAGASPDKLVGLEGGAEFKNPQIKAHTSYLGMQTPADLLSVKKDYFYQCHMCMLATGRKWWDFVSYCPHEKLPPHLHLFQMRIDRDEKVIETLRACILAATEYKGQLLARWAA
jgi:hypothetical protein